MACTAQARRDGGVVVAVGGGDHPRCGGPIPAGDARAGRPCGRSAGRGGGCSRSGARCARANSNRSMTRSPVGARRSRRRRGYRSAAERFAKTRRLAVLSDRLTIAECALAAGRPSITVGGKRLWRNRNHLDATDMTEQAMAGPLGRGAAVLDRRRRVGQGRRQRDHPRRRGRPAAHQDPGRARRPARLACGDRRPDTVRPSRPGVG